MSFLSKLFNKNIKYKQIVSYTTRPKRPHEIDGIEHYFITDEKADELLLNNSNIAAYTQIGKYRYFVTINELLDNTKNLYIIDPKGIKYLGLKAKQINRSFFIVYIYTEKDIRYNRAKSRPGFDEAIYNDRVKSEDEQFSLFESIIKFYTNEGNAVIITNNTNDINNAINEFKKTLRKKGIKDKSTLFLIVGRTCSGKDTFCKKLVNK